jgi:two-component system, LuxR family, sensor kinase FixL
MKDANMKKRAEPSSPGRRRAAPAYGRAKGAPAQLLASEERLIQALGTRRLGVFDWDVSSGVVVFGVTEALARLVPREPGAPFPVLPAYLTASVSDWSRTTHPDDASVWRDAAESVIEGRSDEFTTVYRRSWGGGSEWRWIEARGRATSRGPDGRATRIVGTFENVTSGLHEESERRRLEISIIQAARLTAIAEVASALSHELNQPLTVAMSQIQAASRTVRSIAPNQSALLKSLDDALDFVERGAEIVRRYRRLTSMRTTTRERFDIVASARQIVSVIASDAHRAGIKVTLAAPEGTCEVEADRIQVEQVLLNLVRNGVEAAGSTSVGPRAVTVTINRRVHGVKVDVCDTGPGIPETARESLFKPFFTTKPDGTGLGLSLSRTIVEAHGGRLTLACGDPGRTTFTMELP